MLNLSICANDSVTSNKQITSVSMGASLLLEIYQIDFILFFFERLTRHYMWRRHTLFSPLVSSLILAARSTTYRTSYLCIVCIIAQFFRTEEANKLKTNEPKCGSLKCGSLKGEGVGGGCGSKIFFQNPRGVREQIRVIFIKQP